MGSWASIAEGALSQRQNELIAAQTVLEKLQQQQDRLEEEAVMAQHDLDSHKEHIQKLQEETIELNNQVISTDYSSCVPLPASTRTTVEWKQWMHLEGHIRPPQQAERPPSVSEAGRCC